VCTIILEDMARIGLMNLDETRYKTKVIEAE
jgi:hypothetical protein